MLNLVSFSYLVQFFCSLFLVTATKSVPSIII